jgi:CHU_C Type IX secretion signal domain
MKTLAVCLLASLGPLPLVSAQNLVPNPSFEAHITCLFSFGFIDTNFYAPSVAPNWCRANLEGSTDYYHSCFAEVGPSYSTPINCSGQQQPFGIGEAYAGIIPFYIYSFPPAYPITEGREYLQTKLKAKLKANRKYCVGFYTSLSERDSAIAYNATIVAPTEWGLLLSYDRVSNFTSPNPNTNSTGFCIFAEPQITTTSAITNTTDWVFVGGTYTATGGEEWLTIGSFKNIGETLLDTINKANDLALNGAYYYIDNVFVIPMDEGNLLAADTAICSIDFPLALTAFDGFINYAWGNGDLGQTTTAPSPGPYTITASLEGCQFQDTISVAVLPDPVLDLPAEHYCQTDLPYTYTVPDSLGFTVYEWSDGTIGPSINILQAGIIGLTATGKCGTDTDSLAVETDFSLIVDIGGDLLLCKDGQLISVTLENGGTLPNYLWSTGQTNSEILVALPGVYSLLSQNACGSFQDEINVIGCEPKIYVPNVFYPGSVYAENSYFRPFAVNATIVSMDIFDRWGGHVYYKLGNEQGWNGKYNEEDCIEGVYAYIIVYRGEDGKKQILHGDVMLLR